MSTTVYTIELENNKYYVGRSNSPEKRILSHFCDNGSEWTKLHKPIKVISKVKGDNFDEEKYTLIAMDKYGIDNVRGGSYCKVILTQGEKDKALQTIHSVSDKCYKCGNTGHFSKECVILKTTKECCNKCGWNLTKHDNGNDKGTCCKKCGWSITTDNPNVIGDKCKDCDGDGVYDNGENCKKCLGSGIINYNPYYGYCLECNCINCGNKHNNCKCKDKISDKNLLSFLFKNPIEFDKYIRTRLGQTVFTHKSEHLRFKYDATDKSEILNNKKIIELFNHFYNKYCVIIHTRKGHIWVYKVLINDYKKYGDLYFSECYYNNLPKNLPGALLIDNDCSGGTVNIVLQIIYSINGFDIPEFKNVMINLPENPLIIQRMLNKPLKLEKYIRVKLGQTIFEHGQHHLRLNYHAIDPNDIKHNKNIIKLFDLGYNIVIHTYKGNITVYNIYDDSEYDKFWNYNMLCPWLNKGNIVLDERGGDNIIIDNEASCGTVCDILKIIYMINQMDVPKHI
jgi:cellular nucleic acid-binding protein